MQATTDLQTNRHALPQAALTSEHEFVRHSALNGIDKALKNGMIVVVHVEYTADKLFAHVFQDQILFEQKISGESKTGWPDRLRSMMLEIVYRFHGYTD